MIFKNQILVLLIFLISVVSCYKDKNENPVSSGQFTYNNQSFSLSHGALAGYGATGNNSFGIQMILLSSGLNIVETNGTADSIAGTGELIGVTFYSASQTVVEPGNYTFSDSTASGTFGDGFVLIHYVTQEETADQQDNVESGTINVKKDGDMYDISMNMSTLLGKTTTGNYKGTLKYYASEPQNSIWIN